MVLRTTAYCLLLLFGLSARAQVPLAGLDAWFRSDRLRDSAGGVPVWTDAGPFHRDARFAGDSAPLLQKNALAGYPAVRFNGRNNGLLTPPFASFPGRRGTLVLVARIDGRSASSGVGMSNLLSTYRGRGVVWQFGGNENKYSYYDGVGGEGLDVGKGQAGGWQILTLVRETDTSMALYCGGRLQGQFRVANNQPDTNALRIGFTGDFGPDDIPEVLNGAIAEVLVYGRSLSEAELETVHHYLAEKYDLALQPLPLWQRWWFILLAGMLVLATAVLLTRYVLARSYRKKLDRLEQDRALEAERNRISRDMHDEIGSGLTQIALISDMLLHQQEAAPGWRRDLETIASSSRRMVQGMSEIIWALNPQNDSLSDLMAYIREQTQNYLEPFDIELEIDFPEELPEWSLSQSVKRNLFLVIREAVHNALKHSGAMRIRVALQANTSKLVFSVEDNGCGIVHPVRAEGNGLRNMSRRMKEIGGSCEIASGARGTLIRFIWPAAH